MIEDSGMHSDEINLRTYFQLFRRRVLIIVLISLLSGFGGFLVSRSLSPIYQSSTLLLVSENPATLTNEYNAILTSERLTRTYSELLVARPNLEAVRAELDLDQSIASLNDAIYISPVANTQLIEIRVEDSNPNRAALIANTLVNLFIKQNDTLQESRFAEAKDTLLRHIAEQQNFIDQIQAALDSLPNNEADSAERSRLEQLLGQYRQSYTQLLQSYEQIQLSEAQVSSNIVIVEPAVAGTVPIRPRVVTNTLFSLVAGMAVTFGVIILIENLDSSIKKIDDVKAKLGLPVLAFIEKNDKETNLITANEPRSPISEAFRSLRTNIQFASVDSQIKTIMVTSAIQGEGKTTVAANLAFVMSQLGTEIILVDADLRRPKLHKVFEVSNKKGLSNLFVNKEMSKAFTAQLQKTKHEHLNLLASGGIPPNPSELISTARMMDILKLAEEKADLVIIDAPPVLPVTDAAVLAQKADGVIIVMVPGKTTMPMAKQTLVNLRQVNAKIIGAVFNNVDLNSAYFSPYKNGYRYLYDHES